MTTYNYMSYIDTYNLQLQVVYCHWQQCLMSFSADFSTKSVTNIFRARCLLKFVDMWAKVLYRISKRSWKTISLPFQVAVSDIVPFLFLPEKAPVVALFLPWPGARVSGVRWDYFGFSPDTFFGLLPLDHWRTLLESLSRIRPGEQVVVTSSVRTGNNWLPRRFSSCWWS